MLFNMDVLSLFLVFIVSMLLIWRVREFSVKHGLFIDTPNERSSHRVSVPRSGGIPIALISLAAVFFFGEITDIRVLAYMAGAVIVVVLGIFDDLSPLSSNKKFLATSLIALIPLFFGLRFPGISPFLDNAVLLNLLSFAWIFGMMNAFNFMDGIDGLIGGCSIIFSMFVAVLAYCLGDMFVLSMSLVILSSCAAFLRFNFSPASIFLGDTGSMFLGYTFSVFSIMLAVRAGGGGMFYAFSLVFAVIIFDSMFTFFKRAAEKKNVTAAHREHLYQRLVRSGFSHRQVSSLYYLLASFSGACALLFMCFGDVRRPLALILAGLVFIGYTVHVYEIEKRKAS